MGCAASIPIPKLGFKYDKSKKNSHVSGQVVENKSIFGNVEANIQPPEVKPPCFPTEFGDIQDSIKWFTGRKNELDKLHEQIQASKGKQELFTAALHIRVISGTGGVGKTQFVRNYIQRHKGEYEHVLWIKAETIGDARSCFVRIANECNITITDFHGKLIDDKEIVRRIYNSPSIEKSLYVFDNLEDEGQGEENCIKNFLPSSIVAGRIAPTIIVTTRHPNWSEFSSIQLQGLSAEESYELLTAELKIEKNNANQLLAFEINEMFQGHPLTLKQVIHMIRDEDDIRNLNGMRYSLKEFLDDWKQKEAFKETHSENIPVNIFALYDLAIQKLKCKPHGNLAIKCLDLMAILDPDEIPRKLLTTIVGDVSCDLLLAAIKLLESSGLITSTASTYQIHRFLQVVRNQSRSFTVSVLPKSGFLPILNPLQKLKRVIHISNILKQYIQYISNVEADSVDINPAIRNAVRLHRYCVSNNVNNGDHMYKFETTLAVKCRFAGMDDEFEQILLYQLKGGYSNKQLRSTRCWLYSHYLYGATGKLNEAQKICADILHDCEKRLGHNHSETQNWVSKLASVYKCQKNYFEAKKLYEALYDKQRVSNHPDTLETLCEWVNVHSLEGNFELADIYLQRILFLVFQRRNAIDYKILKHIADIYIDGREYTKAEKIFENFLAKHNGTPDLNDPVVCKAMEDLARVYVKNRKPNDAELLYQKLFDDRKNNQNKGVAHQETLLYLYNLVQSMIAQSKFVEAETIYQTIIPEQEQILQPGDAKLLQTMKGLGDLYDAQYDWDKGIEIYEIILEKQIKHSGETLSTVLSLAGLYRKAGNLELSEKYYLKYFGDCKKLTDCYIFELQEGLKTFIDMYIEQGRLGDAETLLRNCLEERYQELRPNHFSIISKLEYLTEVLLEGNKYNEILVVLQRWLETFRCSHKSEREALQIIRRSCRSVYARKGKEYQPLELHIIITTQSEEHGKDIFAMLKDILDFVSKDLGP